MNDVTAMQLIYGRDYLYSSSNLLYRGFNLQGIVCLLKFVIYRLLCRAAIA